ncbi:MAG: lipopolysaccharide kinase, partial [Actinomycetales bacterium]
LSNVLFRRDAGCFAAYLVDAETGELHDRLTDGQRAHDMEIARVNIFGEFSDLEAGGLLDPALDPLELVKTIETRYNELWKELTSAEEFLDSEMHRLEGRVRRLNALGFDVAEFDITTSSDGRTIRVKPKVVDPGYHSRRLMRLTGLDTEENQARRLLNDLDTYRAATGQAKSPESVVAHRWLTEVFEPVVAVIPPDLRGKRDAAQFFHEVLDYRWYQSQREHRDVPLVEASHGYVRDILANLPDEAEVAMDRTKEQNLADPYHPNQGFADELDETEPYDPWEAAASDPELPQREFLDITALREKAKQTAKD